MDNGAETTIFSPDDKVAKALVGIDSGDAVTSLVSWHRLEQAGLAITTSAGSRLAFRLTPEGGRLKAALS